MLLSTPGTALGSPPKMLVRPGWPFVLAYGAFPVWWAIGAGSFVWLVAALPMTAWLLVRRRVLLPPGLGVWLLFLAWMTLSATQLDSADRLLGFAFRLAQYGSLTVLLVYLYNLPRDVFPLARALRVLVVYWTYIVLGGLVAVGAPDAVLPSLTASLLPARVLSNEFVATLVTPEFAQVQDFLGYPLPRPAAPFPYTNTWGASFALLLPVVSAYLVRRPRPKARPVVFAFLLASLVPAIVSVNRGMWASIAVGMLAALALTRDRRLRVTLSRVLVAVAVLGVVVALSPLGDLVVDRFNTPHSNSARGDVIDQTIARVEESPVLGYGGPRPYEGPGIRPSLGTQGYLWLLLFSHGVPGLTLFLVALAVMGWHARRAAATWPWAMIVLVMLVVQLPVYDLLEGGLNIVVTVLALALREARAEPAALR